MLRARHQHVGSARQPAASLTLLMMASSTSWFSTTAAVRPTGSATYSANLKACGRAETLSLPAHGHPYNAVMRLETHLEVEAAHFARWSSGGALRGAGGFWADRGGKLREMVQTEWQWHAVARCVVILRPASSAE